MSASRQRSLLRLPVSAVAALLVLLSGCSPELGTPPATCSTQAVNAGESALMEPGGDCVSCHGSYRGPTFTFSGTVMNAKSDDQNCQGLAGLVVRVTDAAQMVIEMKTNANGNFFSEIATSRITFPYTAEVIRDGLSRKMAGARSASETNCASCHYSSSWGAGPGRILPPS